MKSNSKIYVAGHRGLVGSALLEVLSNRGYTNLVVRERKELDLTNKQQVSDFFASEKPEYVFNAAAKVGGIRANDTMSADFIYENLCIQNNIIHQSYLHRVEKLLFLGSVCIYPKYAPIPVKESSLLNGDLEPTNEAYAIAKIAGIKMCQAYYKQYGLKSVCLMPANLYGPNDNFDPETSHVIPGMMHKFHTNREQVVLWGDGSARREFMHSHDLADACIFAMNSQIEDGQLINVGTGVNISIYELAKIIKRITKHLGNVVWDTSKPNGTPNRPLDLTKITEMGWSCNAANFEDKLRQTYDWYLNNE